MGHPIMMQRAKKTFAQSLVEATVFPFSRNGFVTMLACGIVFGVLNSVPPLGTLVALAAWSSYLFVVIRSGAEGHADVPESEDFSHAFELFAAMLKAAFALFLSVVPFLFYTFKIKPALGITLPLPLDPFAYLTAIVGLAWTPIAIMLAAINSPVISIAHPLLAWHCIRQLGRDYVLATVVFWACALGWAILNGVGHLFVSLFGLIPFIPKMFAEAVALYPGLVGARALGQLLFLRGAEIGFGQARDYLVPALGDIMPPEEESVPSTALPAETTIELSPEIATSLAPVAPHEAHQKAPALAEEELPTDEEIRVWADLKQFEAVAVAYRSRQGAVSVLSADELVETGRAAFQRKDWQTAAHALKRVGRDYPDCAQAPQALLVSGRLLSERLQRNDEGLKLLGLLIRQYPESGEAAKARAILEGIA
jgi:tetratricopeptide (TPR) repeat protein